jgi:4-hydroxybenzoate polyprenyltransferase
MNERKTQTLQPAEQLRAYAELIRLPNLFTAMADVMMGFLFTHPLLGGAEQQLVLGSTEKWHLGLLTVASICLYASGVVLNDVYDYAVDLRERPNRPIPSGRVPLAGARTLGWFLLGVGMATAGALSFQTHAMRPVVVAVTLAACVALYDAILKRTVLGPLAMGLCRMLNVLLGMSLLSGAWRAEHWLAAGAIGTYIVGVTWFARQEAETSRRAPLVLGTAILLGGIGMLYPLPTMVESSPFVIAMEPWRWSVLLGALAVLISWRCVFAVFRPEPRFVQGAVGRCILSVIVLDAVACYAACDVPGAIMVLVLLIAAAVASRLSYST